MVSRMAAFQDCEAAAAGNGTVIIKLSTVFLLVKLRQGSYDFIKGFV